MEEAVTWWMRHGSRLRSPSSSSVFLHLPSSLVSLSFTLSILGPGAESVASPSLHLSNHSAYSIACARALIRCIYDHSSSFLSLVPNLQVKPLHSFFSLLLPQLPFSAPFSLLLPSVCLTVFSHACIHSCSLSLSLCTPPYACGSFCLPTPSSLSLSLSLHPLSLQHSLQCFCRRLHIFIRENISSINNDSSLAYQNSRALVC